MDYSSGNSRMSQMKSDCSSCREMQGRMEEGMGNCLSDKMVPGMAYVPFQKWDKVFDPDKGLRAGTIFPSLLYNFYGCIPAGYYNNKQKGGRC